MAHSTSLPSDIYPPGAPLPPPLELRPVTLDRTRQWPIGPANRWHDLFSNFEPTPILLDGYEWPTGEHAYQALKTLNQDERQQIFEASSPGKAKKLGRRVTLRPGWEPARIGNRFTPGNPPRWSGGVCIQQMRRVLLAKLDQHPDVAAVLQHSGEGPIIEVTSWNDTRWGTNNSGKGGNWLGQLFMELRGWGRDIHPPFDPALGLCFDVTCPHHAHNDDQLDFGEA